MVLQQCKVVSQQCNKSIFLIYFDFKRIQIITRSFMGQGISQTGAKQYKYRLKTGEIIRFSTDDLKGKHNFSQQPSNEEVQRHLAKCLDQTTFPPQKRARIQAMATKYKHRFAQKHDKMVKLVREQPITTIIKPNTQRVSEELKQKLKIIEFSKSIIKPLMVQLQHYIDMYMCHEVFFQIEGVLRLLLLLEREERKNRSGLKHSYSNQIEIMKFLRQLQTKHNELYMPAVMQINNYFHYLLYNLHPINVAATVSVIDMLVDYIWSCQDSSDPLCQIQSYVNQKTDKRYSWILQPFVQLALMTNNILMVFYILKFVNQLFSSLVDNQRLDWFRKQLRENNYHLIIDILKKKIQKDDYKLQFCTFEVVQKSLQQNWMRKPSFSIVQFMSKSKSNISVSEGVSDQTQNIQPESDNEFDLYLTQNNQKLFRKYIINTLNQIQIYYQIQSTINNERLQIAEAREKVITQTFQMIKNRCCDMGLSQLLWRILDNAQYFDKDGWKFLDKLVRQKCGQLSPEKEKENEHPYKSKTQIQLKQNDTQKKDNLKNKQNFENSTTKEQNIQLSQTQSENIQQQQHSINVQKLEELNQELNQQQNQQQNNSRKNQLKPPELSSTLLNSNITQISILPPPPPPPQAGDSLIIKNNNSLLPPPPLLTSSFSTQSLGSFSDVSSLDIPLPPPLFFFDPRQSQYFKQKKKPSKQLKACQIDVIPPSKVQNTVWQDIDQDSVQIDEARLQKLFAKGYQAATVNVPENTIDSNGAKFLSPDRNRNIQIVLRKIRKPLEDIANLLLSADASSISTLQSIVKILPSDQQETKAEMYMDNLKELTYSEKFICLITNIPCYRQRTNALLFMQEYDQKIEDLETKQIALTAAFKFLKQNPRFHYVLKVSLAISNYLNGQQSRGGAWAFKIKSLLKMAETKSQVGKQTAATEMVSIVRKQYGSPIFDQDDFALVNVVAYSSVSLCKQQLRYIKCRLNQLKIAVNSQSKDSNDFIKKNCSYVIIETKKRLVELEKNQVQLQETYKNCAQFYCQDNPNSQILGKQLVDCLNFVAEAQNALNKMIEQQKNKQKILAKPKIYTYHGNFDENDLELNLQKQSHSNAFHVWLAPEAEQRRKKMLSRLNIKQQPNKS